MANCVAFISAHAFRMFNSLLSKCESLQNKKVWLFVFFRRRQNTINKTFQANEKIKSLLACYNVNVTMACTFIATVQCRVYSMLNAYRCDRWAYSIVNIVQNHFKSTQLYCAFINDSLNIWQINVSLSSAVTDYRLLIRTRVQKKLAHVRLIKADRARVPSKLYSLVEHIQVIPKSKPLPNIKKNRNELH